METRFKNSILNIITSLIPYFIIGVLGFFKIRFSLEYLGIEANGLIQLVFRILSYLSLAEMGFGSALIYKLYKPMKEKNELEIINLMSTAKIFFNRVALILVIFIGFFTFIFPVFITTSTFTPLMISLVFLLSATPYIVDYFWHKKYYILICSDQKQYIVNIIYNFSTIFYDIVIIMALLNGTNLLTYILISYPFTIVKGILLHHYVNKNYPYLKNVEEKYYDKTATKMSKDVFILRIGNIINESSDQVILSFFRNLSFVSIYSAYIYVTKYLTQILNAILNSVVHSFGNLLVDKDEPRDKKYSIFKEYLAISSFLAIVCTIVFFVAIIPFIRIWIGKEMYFLSTYSIVAFSLLVYVDIIIIPFATVITAGGLFSKVKFHAFLAAFINVLFSILLVNKYEIAGIVLVTVFTKLIILIPAYIKGIYQYIFTQNLKLYSYVTVIKSFLTVLISFVFFNMIQINKLYTSNIINWFYITTLVFISIFIIFFAVYYFLNPPFKKAFYRVVKKKVSK